MGVRQTTDVLEKGTWILAALIAVLCMTSSMFISKGTVKQDKSVMERNATAAPMQAPQQAPATLPNTQPAK